MRTQRGFRPSESWSLEDRIALSHAGAVAEVASAAQRATIATFRGPYTTTVQFGVDTESAVAQLTGSSQVPRVGAASLDGSLSNTIVFPNRRSPTTGTLTVTSASASQGSLVLQVSGPYANLAPTLPEVVHLTFTVKSATGKFASYAGAHGNIVLALMPSSPVSGGGGPLMTHVSHGTFALVLARA